MNLVTPSLFTICSLLLSTFSGMQRPEAARLQAGQSLLLMDTLDLHLTGPIYDIAFYQDGIIFLKPGEETTYLTPLDLTDVQNSRPLYTNKEFTTSPAAFSFPDNASIAYYSQKIMQEENQFMEKIYEMSIDRDEVSNIRQISFAGDSSRYLHPAVSSDGSIMVFSSDRLPNSGGLDLFVTQKTGEGWSEPQNLGKSINSSGHEWYPFLDSQKNLWFSSSGLNGYGGYDLFVCAYKGEGWDRPRNLGNFINSPQNELGFSIHPQQAVALFSRVEATEQEGMALKLTLMGESSPEEILQILLQMADPAIPAVSRNRPQPQENVKRATSTENPDESRVVFRIQIISSLNENSFPTVLIEGKSYDTFEYYYLGSYRITVGAFHSLEEANTFRQKCLNSGFKQAFVAAFKGNRRVTDPSVFKQ